jgi:hypothetical protein
MDGTKHSSMPKMIKSLRFERNISCGTMLLKIPETKTIATHDIQLVYKGIENGLLPVVDPRQPHRVA